MVKVGLFAGAGDVVRAVDHGLHPAQAAVARGADVHGVKGRGGERNERVAPFVKLESACGGVAGADDFAFVGDIDEKIRDGAGGAAERGVAGADDADAFEQAHGPVHL